MPYHVMPLYCCRLWCCELITIYRAIPSHTQWATVDPDNACLCPNSVLERNLFLGPVRTILLLLLVQAVGGFFVLEQPSSSLLTRHDRFRWLVRHWQQFGMKVSYPTNMWLPKISKHVDESLGPCHSEKDLCTLEHPFDQVFGFGRDEEKGVAFWSVHNRPVWKSRWT